MIGDFTVGGVDNIIFDFFSFPWNLTYEPNRNTNPETVKDCAENIEIFKLFEFMIIILVHFRNINDYNLISFY